MPRVLDAGIFSGSPGKTAEMCQVMENTAEHIRWESLASLIDSVALRPGVRLVIDFSEVQHISSAGLAQLIKLKRKLGGAQVPSGI